MPSALRVGIRRGRWSHSFVLRGCLGPIAELAQLLKLINLEAYSGGSVVGVNRLSVRSVFMPCTVLHLEAEGLVTEYRLFFSSSCLDRCHGWHDAQEGVSSS